MAIADREPCVCGHLAFQHPWVPHSSVLGHTLVTRFGCQECACKEFFPAKKVK